MIALVFAAPWRYGGVEQSFRAWMAGALAAGLLAAALHVVTARDSSSWLATFLPVTPLLGLLALGAVQWHFGQPMTPTGARACPRST